MKICAAFLSALDVFDQHSPRTRFLFAKPPRTGQPHATLTWGTSYPEALKRLVIAPTAAWSHSSRVLYCLLIFFVERNSLVRIEFPAIVFGSHRGKSLLLRQTARYYNTTPRHFPCACIESSSIDWLAEFDPPSSVPGSCYLLPCSSPRK